VHEWWNVTVLLLALRQMLLSGVPLQSHLESGGRLYGECGSAVITPMEPVSSTSRIPVMAAAAAIPPPMIT
jgi:hypothetical protein